MKLQILFGGELAQSVSERVTSLMIENGHEIASCLCMSEFKKANLELTTIYIVQTIENDQAPESATKFFSFVKNKSHPVDLFSQLQYTVIALGDSNLLLDRQTTTGKDCNFVGQTTNKRLRELGGTMIHPICEADERSELVELEPWLASLVEKLKTLTP